VNGVVVSDRFGVTRDRAVWPPEYTARLDLLPAGDPEAPARAPELGGNVEARDRAVAGAARELVAPGAGYDLVLLYFRSVDVVSHGSWKYWRPERFPATPPLEMESRREDVPRAYEDVDRALGSVLAAAGGRERVNVLVVSDHGFRANVPEEIGFFLDFDRVLERLGFLTRRGAAVDAAASRALTVASPHHERVKRVRRGGRAGAGLAADLERALARVTYASGAPAFRLRPPRPEEASQGADLVAVVETPAVEGDLRVDGEPWTESGWSIWRVSGTHRPRTHGLLIAAGPDIERGADLDPVSIRDLAPTILYALGLPYGRDFAGRPKASLFRAQFRARTPLRAIDSWGRRSPDAPAASAEDEKLVEELRALGYLG
jgi:arylsulfatase A-like enzyme